MDKIKKKVIVTYTIYALGFLGLIFMIFHDSISSIWYKGYDRNFNKERIRLNQPIIEDYFIPIQKGKVDNGKWVVKESESEKVLHSSKMYIVKEGKIFYDVDEYSLSFDSANFSYLIRSYSFLDGVVKFKFNKSVEGVNKESIEINKIDADSILTAWQVVLDSRSEKNSAPSSPSMK